MTCLPRRGRLVHEVPEVRVQLGRPARQVDRVRARPVEGREARLRRRAVHHLVGPVGPGVDVAVPARHVAELPEVDLEDLDRARAQGVPAGRRESAREVSPVRGPGQVHRLHRGDLHLRDGQRRAPGVEGQDHIDAFFACSSIWIPWTSEAPPRIAAVTCTASVICSRSAPFFRLSCV